jgi:hypothetical protein
MSGALKQRSQPSQQSAVSIGAATPHSTRGPQELCGIPVRVRPQAVKESGDPTITGRNQDRFLDAPRL